LVYTLWIIVGEFRDRFDIPSEYHGRFQLARLALCTIVALCWLLTIRESLKLSRGSQTSLREYIQWMKERMKR
jgi:hypothetical protein